MMRDADGLIGYVEYPNGDGDLFIHCRHCGHTYRVRAHGGYAGSARDFCPRCDRAVYRSFRYERPS